MRQQTLLLPTLREAPAEAEAISHQLMIRGGYIRQVAAGIYTYLPLGLRVLKKLERIIRDEMDRAGAQELLMPAMQPAELWQLSGRYSEYGPELIRFKDRHDREFTLGPTHEEVVTMLVANEINSYRKLPVTLYQIQTKFRDERRPRFGLLRGREFLMKDAYSFDTDWEGLDRTYWRMHEAYIRIFTVCGLHFRAVVADAGSIGGEGGTHEFMALAEIGEDTIVSCTLCDYAANLEKAEARTIEAQEKESGGDSQAYPHASRVEKFHTPNIKTIEQLVQALGAAASQFIKTLLFMTADGSPIAVLVRGDHEVNEIKVQNYLGSGELQLADAETTLRVTGAPVGFVGPVRLPADLPILVDQQVSALSGAIVGANERDYHLRNVQPGIDFPLERTGDFRNVTEGEPCPCCEGTLVFHRGIEVGHIFKLGTKYSERLGARFLDSNGRNQTMIMGCYGIGVSRLLSAVVEQHHNETGLLWPQSIAPYQVHIIPVSSKDEEQMQLAEAIYEQLLQQRIEVLFDDRNERIGVKLKDSDFIGCPVRIVIGKEAVNELVEYKERQATESRLMTVEEAMKLINSVNQ
ncbi:proline--tRNA ligase [Paenibacillus sp. LMG 31456]|uniref:Proline--tRNA ligase n=1 Tax=Paenibacillus foliorum TaxID=2654974 RepID=A0A972GZ85_9BACL|nr:proline--tRNA ligase [Paenibacillus foliorum]NOU96527.1 proline--tRNA ligase [Paenibacillus foliorum]